LGGALAGGVELSLQVLLGDLHVAQGRADVFVAEQLHQSGEADAEAEHLRGEGVPGSGLFRADWFSSRWAVV
jgi:hypothetical protein